MAEQPAAFISSSSSTSTASSPRTTVASLSRENSTDVSLTSPDSVRSTDRKASRKTPHPTYEQLEDDSNALDSPSEGYASDQPSGSLQAPRYPGLGRSTPLAPHRIARIANSFGVHTPVPHSAPASSIGTRRSASSGSRLQHRTTTATRLLIHVIPPTHLPAGSQSAVAPGRTIQLRRGTLLPLHTTLQGQLEAIKREYNFPSAAGLVVYLLDAKEDELAQEFVGPQISDEAWKLLWHRVLKMDREEMQRAFLTTPQMVSSPPSPISMEDGTSSIDSHGVPASESSASITSHGLRPLRIGQPRLENSSTTTLSSIHSFASNDSDVSFRHRPPGPNQPRSSSVASDSASFTSMRQLPPSPIVGKIEFDIDLLKGRWYEPWSQRKRDPSGAGSSVSSSGHRTLITAERLAAQKNPNFLMPSDSPHPQASPSPVPSDFSSGLTDQHEFNDDSSPNGYAPLDDEDDDPIEHVPRKKARPVGLGLGLLNGDEDDWRDLQASTIADTTLQPRIRRGAEFEPPLTDEVEEADPIGMSSAKQDLDEVVAILNTRNAGQHSPSTGADPRSSSSPPAQLSSPIALKSEVSEAFPDSIAANFVASLQLRRPKPNRTRSIPPPLDLHETSMEPKVEIQQASPVVQSPQVESLAYLAGGTGDRLSIGDGSDILDDGDESDHSRNSQIVLQMKLDSLEKHIAQLSPRQLTEEPKVNDVTPSPRLSPREILEKFQNSPRSPMPNAPRFMSTGFARPTPGQPLINAATGTLIVNPTSSTSQWPAVPFDHVAQEMRINRTAPPVSPTLSRASTGSAPRSQVNSFVAADPPSETQRRLRAAEEEASSISTTPPPSAIAQRPATPAILDPPPRTFSLPQPSSRFSADSIVSAEGDGDESASSNSARVSVKSFTKLFRSRSKSRDSGVRVSREYPPVPVPPTHSGNIPPVPSPRTPLSTSPVPNQTSATRSAATHSRVDSGSDPFHFDQLATRSTPTPTESASSSSTPKQPPDRTSTSLKKRGILKGWGSSNKQAATKATATLEPSGSTPPAAVHSRAGSSSSLSSRGLKVTSRAESWMSVSGDATVVGALSSPSGPAQTATNTNGTLPTITPIDERNATEFAGAAARQRRGTISSLRPPLSPDSTASSGGPRPSIDEVMTPRTSQFDIVSPSGISQAHDQQ